MPLETVFLYSALGGGIVLLVQLGTMLLGMEDGGFGDGADAGGFDGGDGGDGVDADGSTDGAGLWFFEMLSLRTLAAAATFFGLVGGAANSMGQPTAVSLTLACLAGYGAMYSVYWSFKQLFRLETDGTLDIYNAVGQPAEVYVPIAASEARAGKVHVVVQGRTAELQAITESDEPLATGAKVVVTEVVSGDTVKVWPAASI